MIRISISRRGRAPATGAVLPLAGLIACAVLASSCQPPQLTSSGDGDEEAEGENRQATPVAAGREGASTRSRATWRENHDAAMAEAEKHDLPVYMLFTGSDWCPPCQALERNILRAPTFRSYADENLVLLKLDFPRGRAQRESVKAQNQALAKKWDVSRQLHRDHARGAPAAPLLRIRGRKPRGLRGEIGPAPVSVGRILRDNPVAIRAEGRRVRPLWHE